MSVIGQKTGQKTRSDLGVRTASGIVMMAIVIAAIWFDGHASMALVIFVGIAVLFEFVRLVFGFEKSAIARTLWIIGGAFYVTVACLTLLALSAPFYGRLPAIILISGVIGTDIGAYFAGRTFGGPKIAPKISPSKTWSGLFGGMIGAGLMMNAVNHAVAWWSYESDVPRHLHSDYILFYDTYWLFAIGLFLAIIAQAGDFFESWMKRRAGVKDSGRLIPGHGGVFDRTDGLMAVSFVTGLYALAAIIASP